MLVQLAGLSFRPAEAKQVIADAEEGRTFYLEREENNRFDPWAVRVIDNETSIFVGYVPRTASREVYETLLAGHTYQVTLAEHDAAKPILQLVKLDG